MTNRQDTPDRDELKAHLEGMHGHKLCILHQHVTDGDGDAARRTAIEARTLHYVLELLDNPEKKRDAVNDGIRGASDYRKVSQSYRSASKTVSDQPDGAGGVETGVGWH